MRWWQSWCGGLVVVLLLWGVPATAHAGPPFTDPTFHAPVGGGSDRALSPVLAPLPAPVLQRPAAQAPAPTDSNLQNPLRWIAVSLNPQTELVRTYVGSISAVLQQFAGVFELFSRAYTDLLFTTPLDLTVDRSVVGITGAPLTIAAVFSSAATALLIVVVTTRLVPLMLDRDDPHGMRDLLVSTIAALVMIWGAPVVCRTMISVANAIAQAVVAVAQPDPRLALQTPTDADLSATAAFVVLCYWVVVAALTIYGMFRLVVVQLLVIAAPFAGLSLATNNGWTYWRVWLRRMIEVLLSPILWALGLGLVRALIEQFVISSRTGYTVEAGTYDVLSILGYLTVLTAPQAVLLGWAALPSTQTVRQISRQVRKLTRPPEPRHRSEAAGWARPGAGRPIVAAVTAAGAGLRTAARTRPATGDAAQPRVPSTAVPAPPPAHTPPASPPPAHGLITPRAAQRALFGGWTPEMLRTRVDTVPPDVVAAITHAYATATRTHRHWMARAAAYRVPGPETAHQRRQARQARQRTHLRQLATTRISGPVRAPAVRIPQTWAAQQRRAALLREAVRETTLRWSPSSAAITTLDAQFDQRARALRVHAPVAAAAAMAHGRDRVVLSTSPPRAPADVQLLPRRAARFAVLETPRDIERYRYAHAVDSTQRVLDHLRHHYDGVVIGAQAQPLLAQRGADVPLGTTYFASALVSATPLAAATATTLRTLYRTQERAAHRQQALANRYRRPDGTLHQRDVPTSVQDELRKLAVVHQRSQREFVRTATTALGAVDAPRLAYDLAQREWVAQQARAATLDDAAVYAWFYAGTHPAPETAQTLWRDQIRAHQQATNSAQTVPLPPPPAPPAPDDRDQLRSLEHQIIAWERYRWELDQNPTNDRTAVRKEQATINAAVTSLDQQRIMVLDRADATVVATRKDSTARQYQQWQRHQQRKKR